jgi:hypothetical protein
MAKDYKYKDSTPVDEPTSYKDYKPPVAGSGIKVEPMPLSRGAKEDYMGKSKASPKDTMSLPPSKGTKEDYMGTSKPSKKADADIVPLAKGGSASSRADGCCVKGKTKGTIVMCGGGMSK